MNANLKRFLKNHLPYRLLKALGRFAPPPPRMSNMEYKQDFKNLKEQKNASPYCDDFIFGNIYPIFTDKYSNNGGAKGEYFHQDLLVARRIYENNPQKHIDVGSRVGGFVAHTASFREITVLDIRPSAGKCHNITFVQQDFMSELTPSLLESCDSASSLHAMEHFGLGRYGDPVNYEGHLVGMDNLYKILKKGGKLYFSVPIGTPQRIEFNAHRIFSPKYLVKQFEGKYNIDFFSYIDNSGNLHENVNLKHFLDNYKDVYGCGVFEMTKL